MRRRLTWALIVVSCLGLGATQLHAIEWDGVGTTFRASGEYQTDLLESMTFQGHIVIDGDVTIVRSANQDCLPIFIPADTFISTDTTAGHGHLSFYAGECTGYFIQVDNDLIFTGSNHGDRSMYNRELTLTFSGPGQVVFHLATGKMVGFEGFFGDGNAATTGWDAYWDDYDMTGSGVMVYITMDQTYDEAVVQGVNKLIFERFYNFNQEAEDAGSATGIRDSVKISIGKNSFITYISGNDSGVLDCDGGTGVGYGSLAFDPMCYGPGRMLLHLKGSYFVDAAGEIVGITNGYNDGALVISGHYVEDMMTMDGIRLGVNLNQPAGVEAICRIIDEQAIRGGQELYWNTGEPYILYQDEFGEPIINPSAGGPFDGMPSRRGLMVFNENKSIPSFAADTYVNNEWATKYTFSVLNLGSTSIRQGFILGTNGKMELFHNTFLDYLAGSTQMRQVGLVDQFGATVSDTTRKFHNPSAFIVDGLGILDVNNVNATTPYDTESLLFPEYIADAAGWGGRHAQILLRGDARLYLRSCAMNDGFVDVGELEANGMGGYIYPITGDRTYSFTINFDDEEGAYDGSFISGIASHGGLWYETIGEGNNVLDVEGKLSIRSTKDDNRTNESGFVTFRTNIVPPSNTYPDLETGQVCGESPCFPRHLPTDVDPRGALNLPPIKLDYMGQEVWNVNDDRVMRPLRVDRIYPCYNSSSMFLNNEVAMHDLNWHHNDILKIATPEQDKAEPAVVGGEKAVYDYAYWSTLSNADLAETLYVENPIEQINTKVPLISMYDSTLHVHESIVLSGIRLVVTDKFWYVVDDPDGLAKLVPNTSRFLAYNHGDPLDMLKRGYGRTILFGTQQNKMADGCILNDYSQNSYINIYRSWTTDGNNGVWGNDFSNGHLIRLSLETEAQPKYTIQYENRANSTTLPNTFSILLDEEISQYKRVATQVLYLGNVSYSSIGWTTTEGDQVLKPAVLRSLTQGYSYGINEGTRPRPWDAAWTGGDYIPVDQEAINPADYKFSLSTRENDPAEMYINGDNYYFGGRDSSGNLATEPVVASNEAGIFYTNHGGLTHINQEDLSPDQRHYYDSFIDTIFAYRQWPRIWDQQSNQYIHGLAGVIDLPHDQVKFGRSIQPYELDFPNMLTESDGQQKERNVKLMVYKIDDYGKNPIDRTKPSGEEVTIPWNFRTDKSVRITYNGMEPSPTYTPVKAMPFMSSKMQDEVKSIFRSTTPAFQVGPNSGPAEMPESILTLTTGDNIAQLRVSGATKADPFHLYISGGPFGYGTVREITSLASNYFNPGEGAHGAVFLDGGAHLGIGTRDWNEHSNNAWSVLGYDYLTLYPNGNSFIWVNSDIIVADRLPIIPTNNFGIIAPDKQSLTYTDEPQTITFYSTQQREIRILEGGELDLSAFGNPRNVNGDADWPFFLESATMPGNVEGAEVFYTEAAIEFAGNVRVVFEPGSKIRFPSSVRSHPADESTPNFAAPILRFTDEAELIFEASKDIDEQNFPDATGSDALRNKIVGVGKIQLDRDAKLKLMGLSFLGIETDDLTKTTSVVIEISREAQFLIGSDTEPGGSFQIGNIVDRGPEHTIDFSLWINNPESTFMVGREGFFGLGVGTINKFEIPNFTWRFINLANVRTIDIAIASGVFEHGQIFPGWENETSLMAIGSTVESFLFSMGLEGDLSNVFVRGGGNVLFVDTSALSPATFPNSGGEDGLGAPYHSVEFIPADGSGPTPFPTPDAAAGTYPNGAYTIMASTPMLKQRTATNVYAGSIETMNPVNVSVDGAAANLEFEGDPHAFYHLIGFPPFGAYLDILNDHVCLSQKQQRNYLGYVVNTATSIGAHGSNSIGRELLPQIEPGLRPEDSLDVGALGTERKQQGSLWVRGALSKASKVIG